MKNTKYLIGASLFALVFSASCAQAQPPGPGQNPALVDLPVFAGQCAVFVNDQQNHLTSQSCGGSGGTPGNPTATIGATAVNGSATTYMRSDGAPALPATLPAISGVNLTSLNATNLGSGTVPAARMPAFTGDVTTSAGAVATTLSTVNGNVGTFGSSTNCPTLTVNAKGLITAASQTACAGGSGTVTSLSAGNGINLSTNPCVATCTISGTVTTNTQTGASYAMASTDGGKVVTASNVGAQAYSIVQATTAGFTTGYGSTISNISSGTVTATAAVSLWGNGLTTLVISPGQTAQFASDGTNYPVTIMSLPVMAQDTILGTFGSANYPVAQTIPFCAADGAHALTFASHAFGCTAVSGGGSSAYTVTFSGNASGTPGAAGLAIAEATASITDNNTSGAGTAALFTAHSIAGVSLLASNATVTTTEADTFYIGGPPTASTNQTITKAMSAVIATGDMGFKSNASVLRFYNLGGPGVTNREEGDIAWSSNNFKISTLANGTGTVRQIELAPQNNLLLNPGAGSQISFQSNGTTTWNMDGASFTSNTSGGMRLTQAAASSTVPTLLPNKASTNTGVGAQASGNISMIAAGTEIERIKSAGPMFITIPTDATKTDATICRDTTTGDLYTGTGTAGICLGTSSARYKHGIADLEPGLLEIMRLKPKSYYLNADHGNPNKMLYGFMAEDMINVIPALVEKDKKGKPNTADYLGLVPVLVKAMQQQQIEIASLKNQLARSSARIDSLEHGGVQHANLTIH